jgi:hypothetical protein
MLKVGPKRQVFGALTPSVKVGLTIQAEPTNDAGNWGCYRGRDSPFRGSLLMTCEACNKRGLVSREENLVSLPGSWGHITTVLPFVVTLTYMVFAWNWAGYIGPFGFSANCIAKCVAAWKILVRPLSEEHLKRRTQRRVLWGYSRTLFLDLLPQAQRNICSSPHIVPRSASPSSKKHL